MSLDRIKAIDTHSRGSKRQSRMSQSSLSILKAIMCIEFLSVAMAFTFSSMRSDPLALHQRRPSLARPSRANDRLSSQQLYVSIIPNQNEDETTLPLQQQQQQAQAQAQGETQALFDVDLIQGADSNFSVQDMSSSQEIGNRDGGDDELDFDDFRDEGQTYQVPWDTEDDGDDENDGIIDALWSESVSESDAVDMMYSERDEDAILTEREDRLFVDKNGNRVKVERCILVAVEDLAAMRRSKRNAYIQNPEEAEVYFSLEESMKEMRDLIETAGLELVGEITQRTNDVNPKTYIGTGKLKETQELLNDLDSCTVVFDAELSPGQQKSLENAFNKEIIQNDFLGADQIGNIKVVDRTALILDIFAQHAKTREGKLQVDLALHIFRKPRLTRMWTHLERQSGAGGVGLRGPGESQLEIDKRLLRDRIIVLKRKIDSVQKQRDIHRKGRSNLGLPVLALVGYTNAGKSTLLNHLTKAGVMAEDILFATLDPTTRKVKLPGLKTHPEVLLTDTVGFIQKLPTQLVAAFRATLEEVKEADVLVHVMDVSNPVWAKQEAAVKTVLSEIDCGDKPVVRVFNKLDLLEDDVAEDLQYEAAMMPGYSVAVSSITGEGMSDFVATIEESLMGLLVQIEVLLPYTNGKEVNMIQEVGHVEEIDYQEDGTYLLAYVPEAIANRLKSFSVNGDGFTEDMKSGSGNEEEIDWAAIGKGRHKK